MMIAQAIAMYYSLGSTPHCIQLGIEFPGAPTEAACEHAIKVAEPAFLHDNPGYRRLADSPIECESVISASPDGPGDRGI